MAEPEHGSAEAGAGSVLDADGGMKMTAEVEAAFVLKLLVGVVEDVKAVLGIFAGEGEFLTEGIFSAGGVVIALDESEGEGSVFQPGKEMVENLGSTADFGVEKIAGDDELLCLGAGDELINAGKVGEGVAFGNGKTACAKGGRFSKVGVGEDEGA